MDLILLESLLIVVSMVAHLLGIAMVGLFLVTSAASVGNRKTHLAVGSHSQFYLFNLLFLLSVKEQNI